MPLGPRVLLVVYSLLIEVVVWFALVPILWMRSVLARTGTRELRQRLALDIPARSTPASSRRILIHAVSLGEVNGAAPLVAAFGAEGDRTILSTGTIAGRHAAEQLSRVLPSVECCVYLPWDRRAIRRWLRVTAPDAVVIVETEIWPNLFIACRALGIPLFIASGRIHPRDVWRYRCARPFFRGVLDSARWIGVQSDRERDAFVAIGASPDRIDVAGSLKFDAVRPSTPLPAILRTSDDERPVLVAGSTHDPEEGWLIDCARHLSEAGHPTRLVLAPRDVARAGVVANLARGAGYDVVMWSELPTHAVARWDVLVLDRYDTLASCYAMADVVLIGGTFVPVGGHNLLEAAAVARPILVGPHTEAVADIVERFENADALVRVPGADPARALADACRELFEHPDRARTIGEAGRRVWQDGAGSAARHLRAIVTRCRDSADGE